MTVEEIFEGRTQISDIIDGLKDKQVEVPAWAKVKKEYDSSQHEIMTDRVTRKDKVLQDGTIDKAARVTYAMPRIATRRMTQMSVSIPVKRVYNTGDDETLKEIAKAVEKIYAKARIDAVNMKRFHAYFAACEMATIWYAVKGENEDYGFKSQFKLRCMTYSPMETKFSRLGQAGIYPLFDEGDLIALSFSFKTKEAGRDVEYFESYTSSKHYRWKRIGGGWEEDIAPEDIAIMKIPAIYIYRTMPIWEDCMRNTKELEYAYSRQSDIIRKNSAPILKVAGKLVGNERKGAEDKSREVYQLEENGDIQYVTWQQQVEAIKFYTEALKRNMEEELQLPNLSLEQVKGLGVVSGEARKTLLTEPHLKVMEESGDMIEFLDRECKVILAFLEAINTKWKDKTSQLDVEHIITPFIQNDEGAAIDNTSKAVNAGVASKKTAIKRLGWVDDADKELEQIAEEKQSERSEDVFATGY
jgi:hypothetical protein